MTFQANIALCNLLMGTFDVFQKKPYSAITVQVQRLTSDEYEADDMSGIVDLVEVIRLQPEGPAEAARAIRKKLKYGTISQQLRALTVLDGLMENAGPRFQQAFVDEPLLERLRVSATDNLSDPEVREKCRVLFRQWAVTYQGVRGMERIVALEKQLPKRKKQASQQTSKVLRETEREAQQDPYGYDVSVSSNDGPSLQLRSPTSPSSSSSFPPSSPAKVVKTRRDRKNSKPPKPFNLEKEKPQLLQTIASSSVASTNLLNTLKHINRERERVSENQEALNRFETCKLLRRQILRYIQHIESEQWLGSLIHANDELVNALMSFEVLDKSVDDDSDSEEEVDGEDEWDKDDEAMKSTRQAFIGLSIDKSAANGRLKARESDDDESDDVNDGDEDNPFADSNAVHTPKEERAGPVW